MTLLRRAPGALPLGKLHPIPPGFFCVPSAICAITGEDALSVVVPALNRHNRENTLLEQIVGVHVRHAHSVLRELGYEVRRSVGPERTVSAWGKLFSQEIVLAAAEEHCVIIHDGRVFDTWTPHGEPASNHPFHDAKVWSAVLVRKNSL